MNRGAFQVWREIYSNWLSVSEKRVPHVEEGKFQKISVMSERKRRGRVPKRKRRGRVPKRKRRGRVPNIERIQDSRHDPLCPPSDYFGPEKEALRAENTYFGNSYPNISME